MPDHGPATKSNYQQDAAEGYFGPLASARYIRLTTFTPDALPVAVSVDGMADGDRAYFRAWNRSGTARHLRYTDEVQVTACTAPGMESGSPLDAVARPLHGDRARWVAWELARKYRFRQPFLIPLVRWTRRWQMTHYELFSYEAAAGQDARPETPVKS
jgi:PPOX class probable F420-dependent enzyme